MDDKPHLDLLENVGGKSDPLNMTERLYKYSSKLLVRLEQEDDQNDIKASITCLKYLNDSVKQYTDLKKRTTDDDDESKSGSAVRKYAKAFAKNAAGGGKKGARRTAAAERDGDDGDEASE